MSILSAGRARPKGIAGAAALAGLVLLHVFVASGPPDTLVVAHLSAAKPPGPSAPPLGLRVGTVAPVAPPRGPQSSSPAAPPAQAPGPKPGDVSYTSNTKSTRNANGTVTLQVTPQQSYYQSSGGSWHHIDLSPTTTSGGQLTATATPRPDMVGAKSSGSVVSLETSAGTVGITHPDATGAAARTIAGVAPAKPSAATNSAGQAKATRLAAQAGIATSVGPGMVNYAKGLTKNRDLAEAFVPRRGERHPA